MNALKTEMLIICKFPKSIKDRTVADV